MADPTPEQLTDARLAETIAGLLAYRPGVSTFPPDMHIVEAEVGCLPLAARRYIATGAWNLHRKIEEVQNNIREAEASARSKAFEEAAQIADSEREPTGPMDPALYMAATMRPEQSVRAAIRSTKTSIAEKIRARAEEAP